ncbi:MAG: hypothetical protein IJX16_06190 [Clostridia bacterium]|nr:hypothetical protein [Clostridia bacterium]
MNILEKIFDLIIIEEYNPLDDRKIKKSFDKENALYDKLNECLNDEQKKLLEEYSSASDELDMYTEYYYFKMGFKVAMDIYSDLSKI